MSRCSMSAISSSSQIKEIVALQTPDQLNACSSPEHPTAIQRCCSECLCAEDSVPSSESEVSDDDLPSLDELHRLFLESLLPDYNLVTAPTTDIPVRRSSKRRLDNSDDWLSARKTKKISCFMPCRNHAFPPTSQKQQSMIAKPAPIRNSSHASLLRDLAYQRFFLETARAYSELLAVAPEHDYCMIVTPPNTMPNYIVNRDAHHHRSKSTVDRIKDSVVCHIRPPGALENQECDQDRVSTTVEAKGGKSESFKPPAKKPEDDDDPGSCSDSEEAPRTRKVASRKPELAEIHRCTRCETVFRSKRSLTVHMRRHTGERPYRCHLCPGAFMSQQVLYYHMLRHSNARPWKCGLCSKAYVKKHFLDVHMRRGHKPETLFQCNLCNQAFAVATSLEVHKRTHEIEEKLSICRVCLATFPDRSTLLEHALAYHNNVRPFICDQCGKSFALPSALKNHSRVHKHRGTTPTTSEDESSSSDMESKPVLPLPASPSQQL